MIEKLKALFAKIKAFFVKEEVAVEDKAEEVVAEPVVAEDVAKTE